MTREQFNLERMTIKKRRELVSKAKSREQLHVALFKAKVGVIELFRAIKAFSSSIWILIRFVARDFVAFIGKCVVSISKKAQARGHKMDWNNNDWTGKETK